MICITQFQRIAGSQCFTCNCGDIFTSFAPVDDVINPDERCACQGWFRDFRMFLKKRPIFFIARLSIFLQISVSFHNPRLNAMTIMAPRVSFITCIRSFSVGTLGRGRMGFPTRNSFFLKRFRARCTPIPPKSSHYSWFLYFEHLLGGVGQLLTLMGSLQLWRQPAFSTGDRFSSHGHPSVMITLPLES